MKHCVNGCKEKPQPPSKVLCKKCLEELNRKMSKLLESFARCCHEPPSQNRHPLPRLSPSHPEAPMALCGADVGSAVREDALCLWGDSIQEGAAMTDQPLRWREHALKCWPDPFEAILQGRKRFEWRRDDRGFRLADILRLQEWDPAKCTYTGRETCRVVSYIVHGPCFEIPAGYCVMSIKEEP